MIGREFFSLVAFAALIAGGDANAITLQGVLTACDGEGLERYRVLPGQEAAAGADPYSKLSSETSNTVGAAVNGLLGTLAPVPERVRFVQFTGTMADGTPIPAPQQRKRAGGSQVAALRALAGTCGVGDPISLGQDSKAAFAFVDVSCPSGREPFRAFRIGFELSSGSVTSMCLNLGDASNVLLPDAKANHG